MASFGVMNGNDGGVYYATRNDGIGEDRDQVEAIRGRAMKKSMATHELSAEARPGTNMTTGRQSVWLRPTAKGRASLAKARAMLRQTSTHRMVIATVAAGLQLATACGPGTAKQGGAIEPPANSADTVRLSKSEWAPLLNRAAAGFAVRINNYDPFNNQNYVCGQNELPSDCGPAFHALVRNDSYVRYTAPSGLSAAGSTNVPFTPPFSWNNPFLFLMNEISLPAGRASIDAQDGALILVMPFESAGREVVAACHSDVRCGFGPPDGNNKPGTEIDNLVIRAPFRIWVDQRAGASRLKAGVGQLTFTADIQRAGACRDNVLAVFCDLFAGDIERRIRADLQEFMNIFIQSEAQLTQLLDRMVRASVCQLASRHGRDCDTIQVIGIDRTDSLWLTF